MKTVRSARLRSLRAELIDPTVASQNGRVFKRTGDGALVEFRSLRFDGPRGHIPELRSTIAF